MRRPTAAQSLALALAMAMAAPFAAGPATAQEVAGVTPPPTLSPNGQALNLAGCGSREALWMDLYAVALYLPDGGLERSAILGSDTAKAVRLYPVYDGELPPEIPGSWSEQLKPKLSADAMALVKRFYEAVSTDDVATIAYHPGGGTVLRINDEEFARTGDARLMNALLDMWIGSETPVDLLKGGF